MADLNYILFFKVVYYWIIELENWSGKKSSILKIFNFCTSVNKDCVCLFGEGEETTICWGDNSIRSLSGKLTDLGDIGTILKLIKLFMRQQWTVDSQLPYLRIQIYIVCGIFCSWWLCTHSSTVHTRTNYLCIFTESAPLGRFSHRVAMSVFCLIVCLRHRMHFILKPFIGP